MPNEPKPIVCMLSCQHNLQDDRIYWKEAISLKNAGYTVIHIGVSDHYDDHITAEGIRLIQVAQKRYFKNAFADKLYRVLTRKDDISHAILEAAKSVNAIVYHFHDVQINKIGSLLKSLPQKPKVIYDIHESYIDLIRGHSPTMLKPFNYFYGLYIAKWELQKARHYDAIIATEEYIWRKFKTNFPSKPCEIIYNYSYFLPAQQEIENNVKVYDAIYSGSVTRLRGIYEIVATVQLLKHSMPAVKVLVIGSFTSNKLKQHIMSIIEKEELTNNLILHDAVPFEAIDKYYLSSKIGLCIFHPVKLYKNAVFIKTFEYMAFGLPLVGSNFGTIADYIKKSNAGIIADPLKPPAIANAILSLLNHPEVYQTYSRNGIESVKKEYNWHREQKKLIALYETLLRVAQ